MNAWDLMTEETLAWMERHLPAPEARLLEVGCGLGHLAAALVGRGHRVVAIDPSADAVGAARARGVDASVARYPDDAPDGQFDAVLFTRSLHHLVGLDDVFARTAALLAPDGAMLVEDWAWDQVDRSTAAWAYGLMELGGELGLVPADEWRHDGDPHAHWHAEHQSHHEDLKPAEEMLASAAACFRVGEPERAPYFYRYFCRYLDGRAGGRAVCEKVLSWERALIAEATIIPLGLRFVATLENKSP